MSERKLIVCNPGIFFKDNAPAVYPWLLDKLGQGDEARAIQAKYETTKADAPGLLPEMAELFKGVKSIHMVCRQYCWEYGRREVFELFRRFNNRRHQYMLATSLPREICTELSDLVCAGLGSSPNMIVASEVITERTAKVCLHDRKTRKELVMAIIGKIIFPYAGYICCWEDVIVVGNSPTDIPLGKAVQEKGGRFIAFKPKDGEIKKEVDQYYQDFFLTRMFETEGLI